MSTQSNIIKDTVPLNLAEERAKFLADTTYNPQFQYVRPLEKSELMIWGEPKEDFYLHAKKMVDYWNTEGKLHSSHLTSPIVTEEFITEQIKAFNAAYNFEVPVEVRFSTNMITRCNIDQNIISFLQPVRYTKMTISGLLRHELETHYLRRHNHELQSWGDFPDQEFRQTEEGLANLHTFLFRDEKLILKTYRMYIAAYLAQHLSFTELYKTLLELDLNEDLAFRLTLRTKRGVEDTSQPGGLTKDISYFEGSLIVWKWIMDQNHDPKDLYLGRIGVQQIENLKPEARVEGLLYPTFFTDQDEYYRSVEMIGERNNFAELIKTIQSQDDHVSTST